LKYFIFLLLFILKTINVSAQKEGNIWCFGDSVLIDWNNSDNPVFGKSVSKNRGSASSIADSTGQLLFYIENVSGSNGGTPSDSGCFTENGFQQGYIYNSDNQIMENGSCISGEGWYEEHTIIPMPDNDSLYYVFTADLYGNPGINYSIVNMKANDGLGKVIESDVNIIGYESGGLLPVCWFVKVIKHGNGRDWWLIAKTTPYNQETEPLRYFLIFLITPEGIIQQESVVDIDNLEGGTSTAGFSQDGSLFYSLLPTSLIIYEFDRCTGALTNPREIENNIGNQIVFWSAEFSPNNRYFYASTSYLAGCSDNIPYYVFQYDLEEDFPASTRDTILEFDNGNYPNNIIRLGGTLRIAPDNKIYFSRPIQNCNAYWWPYPDSLYHPWNMNLSVINNPDSAYPACNFTPYSFYLGGARTYYGLPNNPNFALGAVDNFCDTSANSLNNSQKFLNTNLNIFPNPCHNTCQIQYKPATQKGSIVITNIEGKVIFKEQNIPVTLLQHGYEINTSAFAKGVYFVTLLTDKQSVTKKLVKL
jgi:Secretion system C-terminal sorting domain